MARSGKRSAAATSRRNEEKRARQREGWREAEVARSTLTQLEARAENLCDQWERDQATGLTDGTAGPGFCPWSVPDGPRTELQSSLIDVLNAKINEFADTDSGRFVRRWSVLPRDEQGGFDWSGVERDIDALADQLRTDWCAILNVDGRVARSGSPLRPLLLRELVAVFNPNFPEDWRIIEEIDRGANIGIRGPLEPAGCWPAFKSKDVPGHPITLFEKESFKNYKSAETEEGRRIVADSLAKEVAKGYLVKESDPDHLPTDAIVSKIALIEKPGRVPKSYRLISDLRRSGANDIIKREGNLKDTASLPGLRALALLASHAVERYGVSARFIELDASDAFRHIAVDSRDQKYLYVSAVDEAGVRQLFKNLRLVFGLASSPIIWIRSYGMVYRLARAILGILCTLYVDDGLFASATYRVFNDFVALLLISRVVGVRTELAKARISVSPRTLGFQWRSTLYQDHLHLDVEIPAEKIDLICKQGNYILEQYKQKKKVVIKDVESFLGRITWASQTFTRFRCHLAELYSWCHKVKSVSGSNGRPLHSAYLGRKAAKKVTLLLDILQSSALRATSLQDILGFRQTGGRHVISITDASLSGIAGTVSVLGERYWFCESTSCPEITSLISSPGGLKSGNISALELLAAIVAIRVADQECGLHNNDEVFTILSDNSSTVEALNKGTSGSQCMSDLLARLSAMGRNNRCIRAFHLAGVDNIISDQLSRDGIPRASVANALGNRIDVRPLLQDILRSDSSKLPICLLDE